MLPLRAGMDWQLIVVGVAIGFVIGLTGMGGGALMTPVLVLFFGVDPLAAVSSDLVASLVMKPVAGAVHYRRRTVELRLVRLLCYGSVPAAFCSVLALRFLADPESVQSLIRTALGVALLLAAITMLARRALDQRRQGQRCQDNGEPGTVAPRPVPTVLAGVLGGAVVGLTSVGSGSLIIVALLLLYPGLSAARLVGTDLVQAIPLVGSAALGHLLFGDVRFDLTASILAGALPAVFVGARLSSTARFGIVRLALPAVLVASGVALLGASDAVPWVLAAAIVLAATSPLLWSLAGRVRRTAHRRGPVEAALEDGPHAHLREGRLRGPGHGRARSGWQGQPGQGR